MPRIAPNVDSLLKKYDQGVTSNKVIAQADQAETMDAVKINKTWGRGGYQGQHPRVRGGQERAGHDRGGGYDRSGRARFGGRRQSSSRASGPFCPGCYYLSEQLGTTIHFRHPPGDCLRKAVTVKMFEMEDNEDFEDDAVNDDICIGKVSVPT